MNWFIPARLTPILAVGAFALAAPASAESASNAWQFEVTPNLFAAGMDGTIGVRGVTTDVDMSFSDILDSLDSAFMGVFEARKGRWLFGVDILYTKLEDDANRSWQGPLGNGNTAALDITFTEQIYQPFVGYRLLDEHAKVDLIGGARYTRLDTDLDLTVTTGSPLLPDGSRSASGDKDWWDGIVGVRVLAPLADKWSFVGYADVGGGGSDLTYQGIVGVNWRFAENYSAKLGYRYLAQDYEKDGVTWDVELSGVYLGLGIAF